MILIRLKGTGHGPTEFDGKYVVAYDPSFRPSGEPYDGGILEVTDDPRKAKRFDDISAAFECWRQSYGLRPDGYLNRPLTAWTIAFEEAPKP